MKPWPVLVALLAAAPLAAALDEVHQCSGLGCAHVEDDEGDGEWDTAVVAIGSGTLEQVTVNGQLWTAGHGRVQAYVADDPDEEVYQLLYAETEANATSTRGASLFVGLYEANDAAAEYRERAHVAARAFDTQGGPVPEDAGADAHVSG